MTDIGRLQKFMWEEVAEGCRRKGIPVSPNGFKHMSEFRMAILLGQIGDAARYMYHDTETNPGARAHGSKEDETMLYGEIILHAIACAQTRGIDVVRGLELAEGILLDKDWAQRVAVDDEFVQGQVACWNPQWSTDPKEPIRGIAVVPADDGIPRSLQLGVAPSYVLVMEHPRAEHTPWMLHPHVTAVVTDQGGVTCHAAKVCHEKGKAAIVGTGNATKRIKPGQNVTVYPDGRVVSADYVPQVS